MHFRGSELQFRQDALFSLRFQPLKNCHRILSLVAASLPEAGCALSSIDTRFSDLLSLGAQIIPRVAWRRAETACKLILKRLAVIIHFAKKKRSDVEFLDGKRSEKDCDHLRCRNGFYCAPFGSSLALLGQVGLMMVRPVGDL